MNARIAIAGLLCIVNLQLAGCTSNEPFHTKYEITSSSPPEAQAVIEDHRDVGKNYKLCFVEFDDQGWFYDYNKLDYVEKMIRLEAGLPLVPGPASAPVSQPVIKPNGIILVSFVHGWKDNAASNGDSVSAFRGILAKLSANEQARAVSDPAHPPRKVIGVFVGWRGLSATLEPSKELSFWEREDTAHKVGGYGGLTRLLVDLEDIQNDSLAALPAGGPRSEFVIVGHSFGGAAVFSALSQIFTERFARSLHDKTILKPLGDQVILINPAFEAERYFDLNQMATMVRNYPHMEQRPVFSIFTSEGDWATHYAFPVGRFFATLFDSNRGSEQASAAIDAVGWHKLFLTHELKFGSIDSTQSRDPATDVAEQTAIPNAIEAHNYMDRVTRLRGQWNPAAASQKPIQFDQCYLKPIDDFKPGDPFLVVLMDPRIMSGHTDITNPVLDHFLLQYIQFCQPALSTVAN